MSGTITTIEIDESIDKLGDFVVPCVSFISSLLFVSSGFYEFGNIQPPVRTVLETVPRFRPKLVSITL